MDRGFLENHYLLHEFPKNQYKAEYSMVFSQTETPIVLDIDTLRQNTIPGIDDVWGALLAKACVIALKSQHHESGVLLSIKGVLHNTANIRWQDFVPI